MKIIHYITFITFSLYFLHCASQIAPGGGEIDKIPPEIISVYPTNGTTNFEENFFELTFSEYVDKSSVRDAVFISPAIEGGLEFDWSGKSVRVEFPFELKKDLTYVITIGTEAADLNNKNKMAQAFQFAFSTGSEIDKGVIEGKVYTEKPLGIMIFAYAINDTDIIPSQHKPKYISQTGINGEFKLLGLADGKYRVFAVRDEFSDLLYNIGGDEFGVPFTEINLTSEDTLFSNLNYFLSKEDTTKPRLLNAAMTDKHHILIEISEEYDSTIISANNFYLVDSTDNKKILPLYAYHGKTKVTEMVLVINEHISTESNVYLFANQLNDLKGNISESDFTFLTLSDRPDTSAPKLYASKNYNGSTVRLNKPEFLFQFDDAFDSADAVKGISVNDLPAGKTGKQIPFQVYFIDDASFVVKVNTELKAKENYSINIDLRNIIDAAGNSGDSIYTYKFSPAVTLDFTGASGEVKNVENNQNKVIVVLEGTEKDKRKYEVKAAKKSERLTFNFDKVTAGKYLLWSYVDKDSSQTYTYGNMFPFVESERFTYYPDTLNLRARWPVGDIVIEYGE